MSMLILLISFSAPAEVKKSLLQVNYQRNGVKHTYEIFPTLTKKSSFSLAFTNQKNLTKSKELSEREMLQFKNEATRIIWENDFRRSIPKSRCQPYVTIVTPEEKTRVCMENKSAVGRALGFLNSLNQRFNN